jgi:hypothetical protein
MIWAILILLGVPLWLCAAGITVLIVRSRSLSKRHGDVAVRVLRPGKKRWTRAHALWVSDVLAWRGSPASWREDLAHITAAELRSPTPEENGHLHRLDDAVIASMRTDSDMTLTVATEAEYGTKILGPYAARPART